MKSTQMRYLLALLNQPELKQNQANIARIFGVNKSTVSRAVNEAVEQGILQQKQQYYALTQYGRKYVTDYEKKLRLVTGYLSRMGISEQTATGDAYSLMEHCSEETLTKLMEKGRVGAMYEKFSHYPNKKQIEARDLAQFFEEGSYQFPFLFYRIKRKKETFLNISMANDGFCHPATVVIGSCGSYVELMIKDIIKYSEILAKKMEGHLEALRYQSASVTRQALINEGKVYIPLEALHAQYVENENLLYASLPCTISCSAGKFAMPESTAWFVLYFI